MIRDADNGDRARLSMRGFSSLRHGGFLFIDYRRNAAHRRLAKCISGGHLSSRVAMSR
jgi:hypothetical protein